MSSHVRFSPCESFAYVYMVDDTTVRLPTALLLAFVFSLLLLLLDFDLSTLTWRLSYSMAFQWSLSSRHTSSLVCTHLLLSLLRTLRFEFLVGLLFLNWLATSFFPAVDALGPAGVVDLQVFRADLTIFNLPPEFQFAETMAEHDNGRDSYQIFFNGNSIGISAWPYVHCCLFVIVIADERLVLLLQPTLAGCLQRVPERSSP